MGKISDYLQLIGSFVVTVIWHVLSLLLPILFVTKHMFLFILVAAIVFMQISCMTWYLYFHE